MAKTTLPVRTNLENSPSDFMNMDTYTFIKRYLISSTKPDATPLICTRPEDPKTGNKWPPQELTPDTLFPSNNNHYISISSCRQLNDPTSPFHGQYRNKRSLVSETHMFMLDDLGDNTTPEKTNYHELELKPTWVIETSPHNYQALYILKNPLMNEGMATAISKQLPCQAGTDESAVNSVRWARLPRGVNNKEPYVTKKNPQGFPVTIAVANPNDKYEVSEIIDAFHLKLENKSSKKSNEQNTTQRNQPIQALEGWARHVDATVHIPPDCDYQTWFNVACVLHAWGERGLDLFIQWSQASETHKLTDQEITDKFNSVEYDSANPKGHDSVLSWPWLQATAIRYGWDYDQYSFTETKAFTEQINKITSMEEIELLCLPIHDAFLSAPDLNHIVSQLVFKSKEINEPLTTPEVRAMINKLKKISPEDECWTYPLTDEGNLERFHAAYKDYYYYIPEMNHHLEWEEDHWEMDRTSQNVAINTINHITKLERNPLNETQIEMLKKWRTKCGGYGHISALTTLIRKDKRISKSVHDFNTSETQLGIGGNKVLNLETKVLANNIAENLITLSTRFAYDEGATCPRWEQFIFEIMDGNKEMTEFLQILSGYALHGKNTEQIFIVLNGNGANGKSTFANTLEYLLKDYATTTAPSTLIKPAYGRSAGAASPDLMRLFQKRLVLCNEWEEGMYLNESLIKSLTGFSDPVSIRALYANTYLEYVPKFLLMLATNHIPRIVSMDEGIWRRLLIIPFNVNFNAPENKHKRDRNLAEYFKEQEATGIFNWMVKGYHLWREKGIDDNLPEVMKQIKQSYRSEMDTVGQFIGEACVLNEPKSKVTSSDLYNAYKYWCENNGNHPKAARTFSSAILERGHKRVRIGTVNGFDNIRLITLSEQAEMNQLAINEEKQAAAMRVN